MARCLRSVSQVFHVEQIFQCIMSKSPRSADTRLPPFKVITGNLLPGSRDGGGLCLLSLQAFFAVVDEFL